MRILHVAAECYPLVRTGGLGDVLGALPVASRNMGDDARLLLPGYPDVVSGLHIDAALPLPGLPAHEEARLLRGHLPATGLPLYVLDAPRRFARPGNPYLGPDGHDWPDNAERFGLLCRTAAALAGNEIDPGWLADVVHAHDWHAGLVPAYLRQASVRIPSIFTIHNIAFQGLFPLERAAALGLPPALLQPDGLEFWQQISFMKAGIVYSDRVTTVSPGYAREIATPAFGCGLEGVIAGRGRDVSGILNGVDDAVWNPESDPLIAARFDGDRIMARAANRAELFAELSLDPTDGILFGAVSRLTDQKGLDLVLEALPSLLGERDALALLGSGDAALEQGFRAAAERYPGRVAAIIGYDDRLSHRLIAASDAVLVPSRFEPCGLTQLYALRYGAPPIVRRTGGLADTVSDATDLALDDGSATGFVFDQATPEALIGAVERARALHRQPDRWRLLQASGMRRRFSWAEAAAAYRQLYASITAA